MGMNPQLMTALLQLITSLYQSITVCIDVCSEEGIQFFIFKAEDSKKIYQFIHEKRLSVFVNYRIYEF